MKGGWLGVYAIGYLIFLYAPILLLPLFAFNDSTIIAFPLDSFTTKWFAELKTVTALHDALKNSLVIAVTAAILATTASASSRPARRRATAFRARPGSWGSSCCRWCCPRSSWRCRSLS
jgi:spermidine/putrescine transport system permease protein